MGVTSCPGFSGLSTLVVAWKIKMKPILIYYFNLMINNNDDDDDDNIDNKNDDDG